MSVEERLQRVEAEAGERIDAAATTAEVDALEAELLGSDSMIAAERRALRDADEEERRHRGRTINAVASSIRTRLAAVRQRLEVEERSARLVGDRVDVTLRGRSVPLGSRHLVMQVWDEVVDIFVGLGYTVADGPEVETSYYNFTALNTPETHPARFESDTLYVEHGPDEEGVLLRTQTSPMQARYMEQHDPPVHIVVPGRVFRRDAVDATHMPVFHQMEGLAVDEDITLGDLKGTLHHFAAEFFGAGTRVRFLPHFFPFTEPSAEMLVSCFNCDGSGCRICARTGWIELLGCGMVDPAVFEAVGYDPDRVTGFAFGVGIDRLAMIRYGVPELRYFFDPDIRVLEQHR